MENCAGYISLVMADTANNVMLELGGAGFTSQAQLEAEWENVPEFEGDSQFVADLKDRDGSIIDDKSVSGDFVVAKLGKDLPTLLAEARKNAKSDNQISKGH